MKNVKYKKLKEEQTKETELCTNDSIKTAIEYFRLMGKDIRFQIGKYLSQKDHNNLKAVCRDFHGEVNEAKFDCLEKGKHRAKKIHNKIMSPTHFAAKKTILRDGDSSTSSAIMQITGPIWILPLGTFALSNKIVAVSSLPITFFVGAAKEKIKEMKINNKIRPFTGEQITFKKP